MKNLNNPLRLLVLLGLVASACVVMWLVALANADAHPTTTRGFNNADPGVLIAADCEQGFSYVYIRNPDMGGTTVNVNVNGVQQPDLQVDSGGNLDALYPHVDRTISHRIYVTYDFVGGGNENEVDQTAGAACIAPAPTTTSTAPPTTTAPTISTTAPPNTPPTTTAPPSGVEGGIHDGGPDDASGTPSEEVEPVTC